jgi:hypothetical protein
VGFAVAVSLAGVRARLSLAAVRVSALSPSDRAWWGYVRS